MGILSNPDVDDLATEVYRRQINQLEEFTGLTFREHQLGALHAWLEAENDHNPRMCLYHGTGQGKTFTSLGAMHLSGQRKALVIAPPSTHQQWYSYQEKFNIELEVVSHAKFRQKTFKVDRRTAIICDEFHLLGGHKGMGWKKFSRISAALNAPLIICSATPNYNDVERCYCVQHILDPGSVKGGYLQFLYTHCVTEQNPFGIEPIVTGFLHFKDAEDYLSRLPKVHYLPDEVEYTIVDVPFTPQVDPWLTDYSLDVPSATMVASLKAKEWKTLYQAYLREQNPPRVHVSLNRLVHTYLALAEGKQVIIFSNSKKILRGLRMTGYSWDYITGDTSAMFKAETLRMFKEQAFQVLLTTATLATGTDGLDQVCDHMIILQDTDDPSLRRQLIGRILPRSSQGTPSTEKKIWRFVPDGL